MTILDWLLQQQIDQIQSQTGEGGAGGAGTLPPGIRQGQAQSPQRVADSQNYTPVDGVTPTTPSWYQGGSLQPDAQDPNASLPPPATGFNPNATPPPAGDPSNLTHSYGPYDPSYPYGGVTDASSTPYPTPSPDPTATPTPFQTPSATATPTPTGSPTPGIPTYPGQTVYPDVTNPPLNDTGVLPNYYGTYQPPDVFNPPTAEGMLPDYQGQYTSTFDNPPTNEFQNPDYPGVYQLPEGVDLGRWGGQSTFDNPPTDEEQQPNYIGTYQQPDLVNPAPLEETGQYGSPYGDSVYQAPEPAPVLNYPDGQGGYAPLTTGDQTTTQVPGQGYGSQPTWGNSPYMGGFDPNITVPAAAQLPAIGAFGVGGQGGTLAGGGSYAYQSDQGYTGNVAPTYSGEDVSGVYGESGGAQDSDRYHANPNWFAANWAGALGGQNSAGTSYGTGGLPPGSAH